MLNKLFKGFAKLGGATKNAFTARRVARVIGAGKGKALGKVGKPGLLKSSMMGGFKGLKWTAGKLSSPLRHPATRIGLGTLAMTGVGIMRGLNDASNDIMMDRYLRDTRFSRNSMHNARVSRQSGMGSMLNHGGINGLSNALSKTRHGR